MTRTTCHILKELILCGLALFVGLTAVTAIAHAESRVKREKGLEVVTLILKPSGFEPSEVTISAGLALINVYNRVGFDNLDLRIEQQVDSQSRLTVREERVPRPRHKWKNVVELTPGVYIVSEQNHPEWTCKIIVQ